jgi:hypothetical protein
MNATILLSNIGQAKERLSLAFSLVILLLISSVAFAQPDSAKPSFVLSFYADLYYSYDFGNPENHERPSFFYNFNRHNEVNLNLGYINASYASQHIRANLGLMAGTYPQYNLAAELPLLQNLWQANVGLKLSRSKNLWLDGGVFASHIGFESAVAKDCWNLTRSILAENSPYYESGVKISYTSDNSKWYFAGLILNGWQRISRAEANNTPAFGTQITFTPNANVTLNYSTFAGNDKPDSIARWRYYHNLYLIFHPTDKLGITLGFDYCMEQKSKGSSDYNSLYSPVVILRYQCSNKLAFAVRGEYYKDENGIIITTGTPNGFQTSAYSFNLDYKIIDNALWRIELRGLNSKDEIFQSDNTPVNQNYFLTTSLAIAF